jgi:hypothetical protein
MWTKSIFSHSRPARKEFIAKHEEGDDWVPGNMGPALARRVGASSHEVMISSKKTPQ